VGQFGAQPRELGSSLPARSRFLGCKHLSLSGAGFGFPAGSRLGLLAGRGSLSISGVKS